MLRPLVVLWLTAEVPPLSEAALSAHLETRGERPIPPIQVAAPPHDPTVADKIEELLEGARTATPESEAALRGVADLLRAHPELPQAAWLMAERDTLEARLLLSRATPEASVAAAALLANARRLEGARAATLGARAETVETDGALRSASSRVRAPRPDDSVFVDGVPRESSAALEPGLHHVQLFRAGRRVSSQWLELGPGEGVELVDPAQPCDELDLAGVSPGAAGPDVPPAARCPRWAVARIGAGGGVEIASCAGSSCGSWSAARSRAPTPPAPTANETAERGSPSGTSWYAWGAVGVAALAATGVILWQSGAFDRDAPSTQFVFTGPSAAGVSF